MKEFGLFDAPDIRTQAQQKPKNMNRNSMPSDRNINFKFGHPVKKRQNYESIEKQSIKLGAQGFPDTEYQPTLMDDEGATTYKMDMNLFPELQSEYNNLAQSEFPDIRHSPLPLKKNANSFLPPSQPQNPFNMSPQKNLAGMKQQDMTHGITIESILDPNHKNESKSGYILTMRIKYKTAMGESLCVVGDITELGQWKKFNAKMKWTEGHIWVLENLHVKSKHFFNYKYVLLKDDKAHTWERGNNRICDMRLLPDNNEQDGTLMRNIFQFQPQAPSDVKRVEIHDIWEKFKLCLQVYYPNSSNGKAAQIQVLGNLKCLGEDKHSIQLKQNGMNGVKGWLEPKYGQVICPYEHCCEIETSSDDFKEFPIIIKYKYFMINSNHGLKEFEKINERVIQIEKPETYKGITNKNSTSTDQKVWVVNGMIQRIDGNFVKDQFKPTMVGESGILIGQFPNNEKDFQQLTSAGVKTIINLMTDEEMSLMEIRMNKISTFCNNRQLKYIRLPMKDSNEEEYSYDLINNVREMHKYVVPNQSIYVHCCSGVTRSPTLVLTYMCMYKKIEQWKNINGAKSYMMNYCQNVLPNIKMVQKVIDENQTFQDKQKASYASIQLPPKATSRISGTSSEVPIPKNFKPLPMTYQPNKQSDNQSVSAIDNKYFEQQKDEITISMQDEKIELQKFENSRKNSKHSLRSSNSQSRQQKGLKRANSRCSSGAPWDDFNEPAMQSDDESQNDPPQVFVKPPSSIAEKISNEIVSESRVAKNYHKDYRSNARQSSAARRNFNSQLSEKIQRQKENEEEAQRQIEQLQVKQREEERRLLEIQQEEQQQQFEQEKLKIQQEKEQIEAEKQKTAIEMKRLEEARILAEEEREKLQEQKVSLELQALRDKEELAFKIQQEERQRLQEELARIEQEQQEIEKQRQLDSENVIKMMEEKLRQEMREQLVKQQLDAEELLRKKEQDANLQIEYIKKQQEDEQEERKKMKEIKKQMKKEEKEKMLKEQEEQRLKLQSDLERQQQEMQMMKEKLEQEELKRKQIEEQSQVHFRKIEQKVQEEKKQADQEKQELLQKLKEAEQKEKQELIKLRAIQEAMLSGSYMRRLQQELMKKQSQPQLKKGDSLMKLKYEEGKNKEHIKFNELGDVSYMSGNQIDTTQNNGPGFENSNQGNVQEEDDNELNHTATTNKLHDTKTNIDDHDRQLDFQNDLQEQFENESAHTVPIKINKQKTASGNRLFEKVEEEAQVAQQKYITELARIAKIADQKRIQKLQQVELERQESLARLKKKQELEAERDRKKKEAEEAEAAIKQIEDYEEEQQRTKRQEQQQIIQEALRLAREEQEKREEQMLKKQEEERKKIENEKQEELKRKENEINQLKELLEKQLRLQAQIESQRLERERKDAEEKKRLEEEVNKREQERIKFEEEKKQRLEQERIKKEEEELLKKKKEEELERQRQIEEENKRKQAEEAKRMQEEVERLEKIKENRILFDAAMARVAGELIIQHVENEITNEFENQKNKADQELYDQIQQQKLDEERMVRELQQQQEKENERRMEMMRKAEEEAERQKLLLNQMSQQNRIGSQNRFGSQTRPKRLTSNDNRFNDASEISNFDDQQDQNDTIGDILKYSKNTTQLNLSPIQMRPEQQSIQLGSPRLNRESEIRYSMAQEESKITLDESGREALTYENMALYFHYAPPLPFKPHKNNDLEQSISLTLKQMNSKIPVSHIYKNLYLIGPNRLNCDCKFGQAFIKVGGGSQKLSDYLSKNEINMQKQLIELMVKHQLQLYELMDVLKQDKKLAKGVNSKMNAMSPRRQTSIGRNSDFKSPNKSPSRQGSKGRKASNSRQSKKVIEPYSRGGSGFKINESQNSPLRMTEQRVSRFQTRPPMPR